MPWRNKDIFSLNMCVQKTISAAYLLFHNIIQQQILYSLQYTKSYTTNILYCYVLHSPSHFSIRKAIKVALIHTNKCVGITISSILIDSCAWYVKNSATNSFKISSCTTSLHTCHIAIAYWINISCQYRTRTFTDVKGYTLHKTKLP